MIIIIIFAFKRGG